MAVSFLAVLRREPARHSPGTGRKPASMSSSTQSAGSDCCPSSAGHDTEGIRGGSVAAKCILLLAVAVLSSPLAQAEDPKLVADTPPCHRRSS